MMNEGRRNSYDVVSVPSYESLPEKTDISNELPEDVAVTNKMVQNLQCIHEKCIRESKQRELNAPTPPVSIAENISFCNLAAYSHETCNYGPSDLQVADSFSPQLMIIYKQGDIHSALHFLLESLHSPFGTHAVATVFVEECIREELIERIRDQMKPLCHKTSVHLNYRKTKNVLSSMDVQTITIPEDKLQPPHASPIVVLDCDNSMLGSPPTGVVCLRSFRTAFDIFKGCSEDSLSYESVNIWNECVEGLYQLVVSLSCNIFYFNCNNVNLQPITACVDEDKTISCITEGFHYETLRIGDLIKIVVFPVTSHIWAIAEEPSEPTPLPISFLNS